MRKVRKTVAALCSFFWTVSPFFLCLRCISLWVEPLQWPTSFKTCSSINSRSFTETWEAWSEDLQNSDGRNLRTLILMANAVIMSIVLLNYENTDLTHAISCDSHSILTKLSIVVSLSLSLSLSNSLSLFFSQCFRFISLTFFIFFSVSLMLNYTRPSSWSSRSSPRK